MLVAAKDNGKYFTAEASHGGGIYHFHSGSVALEETTPHKKGFQSAKIVPCRSSFVQTIWKIVQAVHLAKERAVSPFRWLKMLSSALQCSPPFLTASSAFLQNMVATTRLVQLSPTANQRQGQDNQRPRSEWLVCDGKWSPTRQPTPAQFIDPTRERKMRCKQQLTRQNSFICGAAFWCCFCTYRHARKNMNSLGRKVAFNSKWDLQRGCQQHDVESKVEQRVERI